MKVITTRKAYYKDSLIPVGTLLDLDLKKCPSWAKPLETKETKKSEVKTKDDEVLFDELLTKAIEKNIEVDLEKKDLKEKIAILQEALKGIK